MSKFKVGDKVIMMSKSVGRKFSKIPYKEGIISFVNGNRYTINHDWFLECDLTIPNEIKEFDDKDFEL